MALIAPAVLSVLELFKGPLAGMRFGDVDAEGLASLVAQVESAGVEVADAEAKLAELHRALAVQQDALLALTQRALAYARVYAESDEQLLSELNGISLPRPLKPRKASAPKPSDTAAASVGSPDAQSESVTIAAEPAHAAELVRSAELHDSAEPDHSAELERAREVELDSERTESDAAPVVAATRKSRRAANAASKSTA